MARRIFTKVFANYILAEPAGKIGNAVLTWLAQEDIEVIGAEALISCIVPSENDGWSFCVVELSQVGVFGQDGDILKVVGSEGWNTTPAGICKADGHAFITFPAGFAVPVKEEGYLYINYESQGKSAGASQYNFAVIVYYTKRGG